MRSHKTPGQRTVQRTRQPLPPPAMTQPLRSVSRSGAKHTDFRPNGRATWRSRSSTTRRDSLARGLLGLVAYLGNWIRPAVIEQQNQHDPAQQALFRDYLERRARAPYTADGQAKLAAWCQEKGLKDRALAHYNTVVRLDPTRESAWRRLGFKKQGKRWVKPEDLAAIKHEAALQKQADKQWGQKLEKLRADLLGKDADKRALAEAAISDVTDPRAVPLIWVKFVYGNERLQSAAVQMFGQIDGPASSNALAALAIFSPWANVRSKAIATLRLRDPRDVIGRLIAMLRKPFKFQVCGLCTVRGRPGELWVEGERFNIQRFYQIQLADPPSGNWISDANLRALLFPSTPSASATS